jgi:tetratricopeptide (TPR) repeat protein
MGQAYEALGQLEQALESFSTVLEIEPDNASARKSVSDIRKRIDDIDSKKFRYEKNLGEHFVNNLDS